MEINFEFNAANIDETTVDSIDQLIATKGSCDKIPCDECVMHINNKVFTMQGRAHGCIATFLARQNNLSDNLTTLVFAKVCRDKDINFFQEHMLDAML